jgi:hypothetical protein
VAKVNAGGHAGPCACDPPGDIAAVATNPDSFYLVVGNNLSAIPWRILRLRRQDLAPR